MRRTVMSVCHRLAVPSVVVLCAFVPAAAASAAPLSWSQPILVDHQAPYSAPSITDGIACPAASLCVAVDHGGNVVTSTNPTGGPGAWSITKVDPGNELLAVTCASASLCVAGDWAGNIITSTNPTGGAGAWTVSHVDGNNRVTGVSCPST